jgi:hypothetical protein
MIVFSGLGPAGRNVLWVRSLDTVDARALAGSEDAGSDYFWSPDSRFVGLGAQGTLERVAVSGGTAQTLCPIPRYWTGGAWSRNGVIIFGSSGHGLVRVSENGGATSPVTVLGPAQGNAHATPAFLPDGSISSTRGFSTSLGAMVFTSGRWTRVPSARVPDAWSPKSLMPRMFPRKTRLLDTCCLYAALRFLRKPSTIAVWS